MIALALTLLAPAEAAEPVVPADDGSSVRELVWAQPVTLAVAERDTMRAERPEVREGLLLELRVDPELVVPSQRYEPTLFVGSVPARKLNWDPAGGCAVVWVGAAPDLATTEIYFGSLELPERIDAARGVAELEAARAVGVTPFPAATVGAALQAPLSVQDFREVHALGMERVRACSATESDQQRSD